MAQRIYLIEDDTALRAELAHVLELSGYAVAAYEGTWGDTAARALAAEPDCIVLDLKLPGADGHSICRDIRAKSSVPILMLTSSESEFDEVMAMNLGADDYVTKPFSLAILRARVQTLLRRARPMPSAVELPPFSFDFQNLTFTRNGVPLELSKTEQRLLRLLVEGRGRTLTRAQLLDQVWDGGEFVDENALSVAVKRLRDKLVDAPIRTVYGLGYTWEGAK